MASRPKSVAVDLLGIAMRLPLFVALFWLVLRIPRETLAGGLRVAVVLAAIVAGWAAIRLVWAWIRVGLGSRLVLTRGGELLARWNETRPGLWVLDRGDGTELARAERLPLLRELANLELGRRLWRFSGPAGELQHAYERPRQIFPQRVQGPGVEVTVAEVKLGLRGWRVSGTAQPPWDAQALPIAIGLFCIDVNRSVFG